MNQSAKTVIVKILDKEFRLACQPEAETALKEAALYLDSRMRRIKKQGRVIGIERIAIMAALTITNELLEMQRNPALLETGITNRLKVMQEKIDSAIAQAQLRPEHDDEKSSSLDHAVINSESAIEA